MWVEHGVKSGSLQPLVDLAPAAARPVWCKKQKGASVTAWSVWYGCNVACLQASLPRRATESLQEHRSRILQAAHARWSALSVGVQARWKADAKLERAVGRAQHTATHDALAVDSGPHQQTNASSPWSLGSQQHPLSEERYVEQRASQGQGHGHQQSFVRRNAAQWRQQSQEALEPVPIPAAAAAKKTCLEKCERCLSSLTPMEQAYLSIIDDMRVAVRGTEEISHEQPLLLVRAGGVALIVLVLSYLKTFPFVAEFARCTTTMGEFNTESLPADVRTILEPGRAPEILTFLTETDVALELAQLCRGARRRLEWLVLRYEHMVAGGEVVYHVRTCELLDMEVLRVHVNETSIANSAMDLLRAALDPQPAQDSHRCPPPSFGLSYPTLSTRPKQKRQIDS